MKTTPTTAPPSSSELHHRALAAFDVANSAFSEADPRLYSAVERAQLANALSTAVVALAVLEVPTGGEEL
ncbi:hypothetical protein [Prauserella rugosa]|uniref:Uncharacterized protein n=1 Tax=Prauserella rugosa TaxID=43354 RepID=A0A660CB69_9PSEU|nr:hypothetical protein [Prauserella rugosa]KMS85854.1 hypothetical protein ACZ91_40060 [Streptomyces regensis]TWH15987.1 hypothetical protein JD82_04975 [Prauserella rugosa]